MTKNKNSASEWIWQLSRADAVNKQQKLEITIFSMLHMQLYNI